MNNFERGKDPKTSMGIGQSTINPFQNGTFASKPWQDIMHPMSIKWKKALKIVSNLLKVSEHQILVAVDKELGYVIKGKIHQMAGLDNLTSLGLDNWKAIGKRKRVLESFWAVKSTSGEVYIVDELGDEYYILGNLKE